MSFGVKTLEEGIATICELAALIGTKAATLQGLSRSRHPEFSGGAIGDETNRIDVFDRRSCRDQKCQLRQSILSANLRAPLRLRGDPPGISQNVCTLVRT